MPLSELKKLSIFPRRGRVEGFKHPVTGQPNNNVARPYSSFNHKKTVFIFISHRWLRPGKGSMGHPDSEGNPKLTLVIRACEKLQGSNAPVPADFEVAVWLDFMCIDQDGAPASELEQLGELIQMCDLVLTPIHDPKHATDWTYPGQIFSNWYDDYKAQGWQEYWSRAWCRVEAMLAAVKAVLNKEERSAMFRGTLAQALKAGRRPHVLYGTKEYDEKRALIFLPPLQNSNFSKYKPTKGSLTQENDRVVIKMLEEKAEKEMVKAKTGYTGQKNDAGQKHGKGHMIYPSGNEYDGEWKNNIKHGYGVHTFTDGHIYTGEFDEDRRHGQGTMNYPDGAFYKGGWEVSDRGGYGVFHFADGAKYDGEWKKNVFHGQGTYTLASGKLLHSGRYENGKFMG